MECRWLVGRDGGWWSSRGKGVGEGVRPEREGPTGAGKEQAAAQALGGHSWLERAGEESPGRQRVRGVLAPLQGHFCRMLLGCGSVP